MTDNGRRQWIAVDLGSRNINFGLAAELPRPISTSAIFENTSVNEIMTTPSIFTIRRGERCFGARVLHMREENIIFDAMNVHQNHNNNGNKWYADFHQNCYHLVGENVHIKQSEAIAAILSNLRMELMKSRKIKEDEELGAVLVIPSNAGQIFRKIVMQASSIAGFLDACLLNQSTAVALAYWRKCIDDEQQQVHGGDHHKSQQTYLLGILSMGAKTTECSIFEFQPYQSPKLIKNIGCCDFGGDDFTEALMNQYLKIYENGIRNEMAAGNKIKSLTKKFWESCEEAKKALSDLNLDDTKFINPICDQGDDDDTLTVEKFAHFCAQEFAKLEQLFNECFAPFYGKLESFLLAGGSSQLRQIRDLIAKYAGHQCQVLNASAYEPTMLAQKGAAVKAAQMSFGRANIPMPNYFAQLSMNEWFYRSIQISHNSGVQISVAFPNTQLPSDYEHLAACGHSMVNQSMPREMAYIHIFEINFSSAYLGSIQLSENAIFLTADENGIVLIKNWLQNWEMPSPLLLNDDEFAQAYTEVMKYEEGIKNALKEKEIREKQRIAMAERKRLEEKKRKEEERKRKEEGERKRKEEEDRQRKEAEQKKKKEEAAEKKRKAAEEKKKKDEEERAKKEAEEKKRKEEEERKRNEEEANDGTRPFIFIWPFHFCKNVELQGSWDGWKRRIEMERNTNGNDGFFHKMKLKPGYYEFQFFVENARTTTYLYRKRMNAFGTWNNSITIDDFKPTGGKGGSGNQSSTATNHQSDPGHSSQHEQQSTYAAKVKGTQKGQGNDGSSSSSMQGKNNEMTGNTGQSSSKQSGKKEEKKGFFDGWWGKS